MGSGTRASESGPFETALVAHRLGLLDAEGYFMRLEKNSRVLVTGAAGFIAYHVIETLLRKGQDVVGVDNFDPFYDRRVKERNVSDLRKVAEESGAHFEFHEADIRDFPMEMFDEKGIESVIHLAAKAGVRPSLLAPEDYVSVNTQGTVRLLEFAQSRGIKNFVFGSSSSVYGENSTAPFREDSLAVTPISPYAASKRASELLCSTYCHLYGLKTACLRFFTVYGPRQRPDLAIHKFTRLIQDGQTITLFGDGTTSRDYTYVSDIAKGVVSALSWVRRTAQPGEMEILNLGGSQTTSLIDLVRMIEKELGVSAKIRWELPQPGDVEITFADVSKSRRILDYTPDFPINVGIQQFVEWFKQGNSVRPTGVDQVNASFG
jgi:UDP-glucuronate 4-epimerase